MQNPLRSERDAFRMVLAALVYFGLIAIAAKIDRWLGLAVFVALTAVGAGRILRGRRREPGSQPTRGRSRSGELRSLVVAGAGAALPELIDTLRRRAAGRRAVVQVIGPAAREDLAERLVALRSVGLDATGEAVDGDPLPAVEEAVRRFRPDEIVVAPGGSGDARWPEPGFVGLVRERFDLPVLGIGVDRDATA